MRRSYLKFKDLLCVSEGNLKHTDLRFDLAPLMLYVVDSNGRNHVVAFCLSDYSPESLDFLLSEFKQFTAAPPKQILMKRVPITNPLLLALKKAYSSKAQFNVKPPVSDNMCLFCPYNLHEELKD
jgi:hypothetical protein